ncbi:MAG: hypothetical protein HZB16_03975, partial [Armatimonadetes bacterium]|nr:hypothetical protein [Armatimonadota bacterium]
NDGAGGWPSDGFHGYEEGGYVVKAPDRGSRTTLRNQPTDLADGVLSLRARPVIGPVQAGMGLAFRANKAATSFYFFLINGAGKYFLGKCVEGQYTVLDSGSVTWLRGGDLGNELQVTLDGPVIRYGANDHQLGIVQDDSLSAGSIGLHAENGVVACFRDLRVFALPRATQTVPANPAGPAAPLGVPQP